MHPKKLAALIVLTALILLAVALATQTLRLLPVVQEEMRTTPTPTPIYGSTMVVTPDPNAPTSPPVLKNGSVGSEVTRAQERLLALGYYNGAIDGQFGNATQSAVLLFQQQHGLLTDGTIGPETAGVLYSSDAQTCALQTPVP